MNPAIIQSYAAQPKRYPMWYCTVAIDLLFAYGKNPLEVLPAAKVADLWVLLRRDQPTEQEAYKLFVNTFQIIESEKFEVIQVLKHYYEKDKI